MEKESAGQHVDMYPWDEEIFAGPPHQHKKKPVTQAVPPKPRPQAPKQ